MNHAGIFDEASYDPVQSFRDWQDACASLRLAETCRDNYSDLVRLSVEVIRARNELTIDLVRAGTHLPDDVLRDLARDAQLLREHDDAALSGNPVPSASDVSETVTA
jgi:hypothetical protein